MPDITQSVWLTQLYRYLKEIILKNVTDPNARGTSLTQTFSGDDNTKTFTLTYVPDYFSSVSVGAVSKKFFTDFYNDFGSKTIVFDDAPSTGTNNISVTYRYTEQGAETDKCWILTSFPEQEPIYPAIAIQKSSGGRSYVGAPRVLQATPTMTIHILSKTNTQLISLANQVEEALVANAYDMCQNGFYGFNIANSGVNDIDIDKGIRRLIMTVNYKVMDTTR